MEDRLEALLQGGLRLVQYREKHLPWEEKCREAAALCRLCHNYGAIFLVNDSVDLALATGADGAHLGATDGDLAEARERLGPELLLGATARTVEAAVAAWRAGADYLGSGAVFSTCTKEDAMPMSRQLLMEICRAVPIPVVAIGGISASNVEALAGTGISGVALASGLFGLEKAGQGVADLLARLAGLDLEAR